MDEKNRIESIEYERYVLIEPKYTAYDYNDELWDSNWTILIHSYVILLYRILTHIFFEITSPTSKCRGVCIQGKEVLFLIYSDWNFYIMTE